MFFFKSYFLSSVSVPNNETYELLGKISKQKKCVCFAFSEDCARNNNILMPFRTSYNGNIYPLVL